MSIEEIPADQVILMTDTWHRAFEAGGCSPMCHCCFKELLPNDMFKLATVNTFDTKSSANSGISAAACTITKEVMLCDVCTVEKMNKMTKEQLAKYEKYRQDGGGCHRVNGKIVH